MSPTPDPRELELIAWLRDAIADVLDLDADAIDPDRPLTELGLSSRDAVGLVGDLEDHLDRDLDATLVWKTPTITLIARRLVHGDEAVADVAETPGAAVTTHDAADDGDRVAIVGLGCRLPGGVNGPDDLWKLLLDARDAVGEVPEGRWEQFTPADAAAQAIVDATQRRGGYLDDVAGFDAEFFGITPREAELMDPQQRLLLEVAHEALLHAGIAPSSLKGTATGVFVGMCANEYSHLTTADLARIDAWTSTGSALSIAANRLSYLLDLRGPSMTTDTACSSSLVAVHQAARAIGDGDIDQAVVGGVNMLLAPAITVNFELGGALAPDGRCKPFSADADGIVRAEGCGVVVLKRLRDARRDGDRVLAVIRGTGVNSDGRSNGMMAPNPLAQEALLRDVYTRAGIDPASVDYVEAHGTGTLLGDPIEAGAMATVLGAGRDADRPLLIGSVKSNLGHLEGAAGVAGLIKLVLSLQHDRLPASINYSGPNPHIRFEESRLRVVDEPRPWPRYDGIARAGVSAFGFGGTNAHVVIEQPSEDPVPLPAAADGNAPVTLALSARSDARVRAAAAQLAAWLRDDGRDVVLRDVAHTLARRREVAPVRASVTARGRDDLAATLAALADGLDAPGITGPVAAPRGASTSRGEVWVFSGFGSQWPGMGAQLLEDEPAFAAAIDELEPLVQAEAGFSLRSSLLTPDTDETVDQTQVKVFAMQVALAALWRSYGREPVAVIGHSMGEVAAAVATGSLTAAEGVRVISLRSRLLQSINVLGGGAMAVMEISAEELDELHDRFPDVQVAVFAAPQQSTVAGDADQVQALAEHVEGLGRNAWILKVTGAGHSAAVDPILPDLVAGLADLRPVAPAVPVYTTVHEDPRQTPAFDAAYWRDNARQPVRFRHAVAAAADDGYTEFLEVAPHPVAAASVRQTAKMRGADVVVTPTLRRKTDETVAFRAHAALLAAREPAGDLTRLVPPGAQVDLPLPPWQHERFWIDHRRPAAPAGHPLLGAHVELPEGGRHLWRADVGVERLPWMADHAVHGVPVLPGAAYAEMALSAAAEVLGGDPADLVLRGLELHQVLPLGEQADVTTSITVTAAGDARVEVHARHEGAAAGTPMVRHATAAVSRDPMPSEGWPALPQDEGAPVDLYGAFRDAGHRYGPAFVGVGDARLHAGGVATAQVRLPETAAPDPRYRVHPALLDVCLQTLGVAAQAHLADRPMELYLPLGIGALRVASDPHRGGRCVATLRALDEEANGLSGTLQLIADDGTVLLQADDVYLRRLSRDAIPAPLADKLFEAAWIEEPVGAPEDATPGRWLLLAENATEHAVPVEQLARELRAAGHRIDVGGHGSEHEVADAVGILAADADRPPLGVALVAPTLAGDDVGCNAARELAERLVVSVARIARVVTDAELAHPVRLWVLTRGGAAIADGEAGHPALAALRAAVRVLAFEHPTLQATVVDLDAGGEDTLTHAVAELRAGAADDEVAWRGTARHVRRLARVALDPPAADTPPPVRDGAYVITGGLGGLGLVVARWLAEGGASRLVLTGRSAPSPEATTAIDDLRALGADVAVVRGDVARRADVDTLVAAATAGGMPLRGIVHAAGVLEDEVVARVTPGAVERVWAPKVMGGWNLHEATLDHDLDLWLVFSSAAALLGSPGQLAYATANAWLDALVNWRRAAGLAATTINWGAWSQVGGVAETSNALLESLSPEEGVEAMDAVLRSGRAATGVVRLDARRAVELLPGLAKLAFYADLLEREAPAEADDAGDWVGIQGLRAAEPAAARQLLADRLLERVATIMAYRPEQIDVHAPLTSLGADSLIAVRAKNAVEHDFEVGLPVRLLLQDASLADIEAYIASELGLADHDRDLSPRVPVAEGHPRFVEPRDTTERWLAGVWEEVLERRPIGVSEPLCPPADQTVADRVLARLRDRLGEEPDAAALLADGITIEAQADLLRSKLEDNGGSPVRVLREAGDDAATAPLFLFHPAGGTTAVYQPLADLLPGDVTVIGFERIDHLSTIEEKAAFYLESIREMQPTGPYRLGGWSLGGCLAYDAARQLRAAGEEVDVVVMIDTILPDHSLVDDEQEAIRGRFERFVEYLETTYEVQLDLDVDALMELPEDDQITRFMEAVATSGLGMSAGVLEHQRTSYVDARIAERYHPQSYDGRVVLYRASDRGLTTTLDPRYARQEESLGWDLLCSALEVVRVTGDHTQIIDRPNVDIIAEHLGVVFDEAGELAEVAELKRRRPHDPAHRFRRGADHPAVSSEPRRDVAL